MKKKFESPRIDVKKINASNMICVSCTNDSGGEGPQICTSGYESPCGSSDWGN